jgi:predicted flap endonuclease-1-like 5' DNA nuclease
MLNQTPGTACSHCGRAIPDPKPVFTDAVEADNGEEAQETLGSQTESEQAETTEAPETTPEADAGPDTVVPEDGHVDNVGDESEAETIVP